MLLHAANIGIAAEGNRVNLDPLRQPLREPKEKRDRVRL